MPAVAPSPNEVLFLERLNDARANPAAYGSAIGVDLSYIAPSAPLAFDARIVQAARDHSQDMNNRGYFSHTGAGGSSPWDRMAANGYAWRSAGESIAAGQSSPETALSALVIDAGVPNLGHRHHLLAHGSGYQHREVGVGIVLGGGGPYRNYYTIDSGTTADARPYLTGVVYRDANGNGKYDLTEGLGGATVSVSGGPSVTTWASGAYSLQLSPGTYTVTASGGGLASAYTRTVTLGSANVRYNVNGAVSPPPVVPPPPPAAPVTSGKYDFGTAASPVASGYTRVTAGSQYTAAAGYGWVAGAPLDHDRGPGTAVTRDFVYAPEFTFLADVPNGSYAVTLTMGDTGPYLHDHMGVFLEGQQADSVTAAAGQVVTRTYTASVADGQLAVRLRDLGGSNPDAQLMALEFAPAASPPVPPPPAAGRTSGKFDFGTPTSPVEAGYARATAGSLYSAAAGWGFAGAAPRGHDRGPGTAATRDFVYAPEFTFLADVPNGAYRVTVTMGDTGPFLHDHMGVFLEGQQADSVTAAGGQVVTRAYTVSVADGQLTARFRDLGGVNPDAQLMALEFEPVG